MTVRAEAPSRLPDWVASSLSGLAAVVGLALAVLAQNLLADRMFPLDGVLVYGVAIFFFIRAMRREGSLAAVSRPMAAEIRTYSYTAGALVGCGVLAALAYFAFGGNRFTQLNVLLWVASIAVLVGAHSAPTGWLESIAGWSRALVREGLVVRLGSTALVLLLVLAVAAFFHFYRLADVPAEPTSDHAEKLLDVRDVLDGQRPIFFRRNTGREPLQFYLAVPFARILGLNHLALKAETALVGVVGVVGLYLLGREFLGREYGAIAALLGAMSVWEIGTARMGLRYPFATAATAFTFFFFFRALRTGAARDFAWCGVAVGIGLLGYSTFRVVPLLVVVVAVLWLLYRPGPRLGQAVKLARGLGVMGGFAVLVCLPLLRFAVDEPAVFWSRTLTRVAGDDLAGSRLGVVEVAAALAKSLLIFNWRGDIGWTVGVSGAPTLDPTSGALFALGLAWLVYVFVQRGSFEAAAMLVALPILLVPSWASFAFPLENPSANRAVPALPIVFLIAALPLGMVGRTARRALPGPAGLVVAAGIVALVLAPSARANFERYFGTYAEQYRGSAQNTSEVTRAIAPFVQATGSMDRVYILNWPHWLDHRNVAIAMGEPTWSQVIVEKARDIAAHRADGGPRLYVVHRDDAEGRALLRQAFPGGIEQLHSSRAPGKEFLTFTVLDAGR
jgi:hypothetical protein